jgi:hypothetical protein
MKGFQKLTKEEMGEIKGGYYSCPRSKGEFTRTYNALNKTQKKEYNKDIITKMYHPSYICI